MAQQQHLDRLTAIDASFLAQEDENAHMHIGALTIFEGPPPSIADFLEHIRSRLPLVPRYRQKLAVPPLDTGRPLWVDDPSFNLEYHVRHTALPAPGDEDQLLRLAARIVSQRLDRSKPLWELWLVEGLDENGFSLISKTHHALVDGVSGVDLASILFDLTPIPQSIETDDTWTPKSEPSTAELVASGMMGLVRTSVDVAGGVAGAALKPQSTVGRVRDALEGVGEVVWAGMTSAPETPFNVPIGPHRRFYGARCDLADFKTIKNTFGGTVNDVVLTVVSGSLARFLRSRGIRTEGLELRAQVPVSVRGKDAGGELGNQIAVMRGPLPVYINDPVARLRFVKESMDHLKQSKQSVGAEAIANMENFAPPTILAQASRLNFSTRLFNMIVTNVPGPQFPLYVLGREMQDLFPIAFLPNNQALAIAIMSYNGQINFGLLADYDALPDVEEVGRGLQASLAELVDAAKREQAADDAAGDGAPSGSDGGAKRGSKGAKATKRG